MSAIAPATPPAVQRAGGDVTIEVVTTPAGRRAFLDLPYRAYRDLPAWRAPLRLERAPRSAPSTTPPWRGWITR